MIYAKLSKWLKTFLKSKLCSLSYITSFPPRPYLLPTCIFSRFLISGALPAPELVSFLVRHPDDQLYPTRKAAR